MSRFSRRWLFIPAALVGVVIFVFAINSKSTPELKAVQSKERLVDVISLSKQSLAPLVVGYGRVTPKTEWQGIAEVSGRIIYIAPELERGRIVPANTLLLRIDPLDYELSLAQSEAQLSLSQAQLNQLALKEGNLKTQLNIEKQRLEISSKELERKKKLFERGLISQSAYDTEVQVVLTGRRTVEELENQWVSLPDDRKVIQSQIKVNESAVEMAKRSLQRTEVYLPFRARIAEVNVVKDQVVNNQQTMIKAHSLDSVEVDTQVAVDNFFLLANKGTQDNTVEAFRSDYVNVNASVHLRSNDHHYEWPAIVSRVSDSVNYNQATAGIILDVQLSDNLPANLPSLISGMFVEAELEGVAQEHYIVPESALHGKTVYLMRDNALAIATVKVLYRRDGVVAVEGEFQDKDLLVLNDLQPAVVGMALRIAKHEVEL